MAVHGEPSPQDGVVNETLKMVGEFLRFQAVDEDAILLVRQMLRPVGDVARDDGRAVELDFANNTWEWTRPHRHDEQFGRAKQVVIALEFCWRTLVQVSVVL